MSSGLGWKRNEAEILERRRRFFRRRMQDGILALLPVSVDAEREWRAFEARWGRFKDAEVRPFPTNTEIFQRHAIGMEKRGQVEDDWLPVVYSTLDMGEGMTGGMFGAPIRFYHRPRSATYSANTPLLAEGYAGLKGMRFSLEQRWVRRMLAVEEHFEQHARGCMAQHNCLTMDALNFVVEMRGATPSYIDIYEHPSELKELMAIGLDFNIRFQEAQFKRIGNYSDGCFCWLGQWVPFARAISFSVDANVMCSVQNYLEFGFEYQRRLITHFGHGLMHFHCNRPDLAAEVARLPGLELFQYGAGLPRGPADHVCLPDIRKAVGEIPIQVSYPLDVFRRDLKKKALLPNVMYCVHGEGLTSDDANRIMDQVRAYRA